MIGAATDEPPKHGFPLGQRDPRSLVGDIEEKVAVHLTGNGRDGSAGRAVPSGVVQQVRDHLMQAGLVHDRDPRTAVGGERNLPPGRRRDHAGLADGGGDQRVDIRLGRA